ncbi:MAG: extracellular solute-binding protein, partial [Phycisphaerales bacterium]|nr:extracellular solute-binding protein [Phycisphaerales bacterium]
AAGSDAPETWEEFIASFDTLKTAGFETPLPMPAKVWAHAEWFESLLLRIGGVEASRALANHEIAWTDPVVKSAMMEYINLIDRGCCGDATTSLATEWSDAVAQIYGAEKSSYALLGGWVSGHAQSEFGLEEGSGIDILQFPALGKGHDNTSSVDSKEMLIFEASENKDTAVAWLDFLVSEEGANILAKHNFGATSKNVDASLYGPVMQKNSAAVSNAEVQFVLGDLLPGDLVDEYRVQLQRVIQNPTEAGVDAALAALEAKAKTFD